MSDVADMAERQKRQIEQLDKLQLALNDVKRRAAGPGAVAEEGTLISRVSGLFEAAIRKACPSAIKGMDKEKWLLIAATSSSKFGDYQCNSPMSLHKLLKESGSDAFKAPRDVAMKIISCIPPNSVIGKTEVAGPGFINVFLSSEFLAKLFGDVFANGGKQELPGIKKQTIVVDFSSPNIAKEMHVGHLRSTIIGECLCRSFEHFGHTVHRVNHVGDWGTQFGMLINHLRTAYPDFNERPPNITDLTGFYKQAKVRFDEDEDFKKASQLSVVTLQAGDEFSLKCWQTLCDVSRIQFRLVYDRLEIDGLKEQGESFYNSRIPAVVKELEGLNLIEDSGGAKVIWCGKPFPLMAVKSDGGYGYDSTDLAAVSYRVREMGADRVVYVTDAGQSEHFEMIFEAARKAKWVKEGTRLDHVPFGLVLGDDKKKFKTRSGEVTKLVDLLDEAVTRARKQLDERLGNENSTTKMTQDEVSVASQRIGYGCVKYCDLRQHRITDYQFSYDKMLQLNGNTAVYLMYSYARIYSIARKAGVAPEDLKGVLPSVSHPKELALVLHILRFPEVMERVTDLLLPHLICDFLYETAEKFNEFYKDCKVIGDPLQNNRLVICETVALVMHKALSLLGITPLEKI